MERQSFSSFCALALLLISGAWLASCESAPVMDDSWQGKYVGTYSLYEIKLVPQPDTNLIVYIPDTTDLQDQPLSLTLIVEDPELSLLTDSLGWLAFSMFLEGEFIQEPAEDCYEENLTFYDPYVDHFRTICVDSEARQLVVEERYTAQGGIQRTIKFTGNKED